MRHCVHIGDLNYVEDWFSCKIGTGYDLLLIVRPSNSDVVIVYRKRDALWIAKLPQYWFWYVAEAACVLNVVCNRYRELCGILCPFCHIIGSRIALISKF